eukprot:3332051-Amphidinium_carterae.1
MLLRRDSRAPAPLFDKLPKKVAIESDMERAAEQASKYETKQPTLSKSLGNDFDSLSNWSSSEEFGLAPA